MADCIRDLVHLDEKTQNDFRTYSRLLLHRQHLLERQNKGAYRFITDERYFRLFSKVMNTCGYDLIHWGENAHGNGLIGIIPMEDLSFHNIKKLPKDLVKVLVALHKIYHDNAESNQFDENLRIEGTIEDICGILNKDHIKSEYQSVIPHLKKIQSMGIIEELTQDEKDSLMRTFYVNRSIAFYITHDFKNRWEVAYENLTSEENLFNEPPPKHEEDDLEENSQSGIIPF